MSIEAYGRLPILRERVLRQHDVYETADTRFRAAARMRQALWREQNGWKVGYQKSPNGKRRKIGNCVSTDAANVGANFISDEIAKLVRRELAFREEGALLDETRLTANLLSSMPVVFNVFGPLKLDLRLATRVFRKIFPDYVKTVTNILFEHAPDRGSPHYTADFTAFDLLVQCRTKDNAFGFIAIEVKYSETLTETPARLRARYDELSQDCKCFRRPDSPVLRETPLQQFWRQHMLAAAMLKNGLYDSGRFVVVAPRFNNQVQNALAIYRHEVKDDAAVTFDDITLEAVIETLRKVGVEETYRALFERYCDYEPLTDLI